MLSYCITSRIFTHPDLGVYTSYGIMLTQAGNILVTIEDISTDKILIENLCRLCNFHKLSPVHLHDVVLDFLG